MKEKVYMFLDVKERTGYKAGSLSDKIKKLTKADFVYELSGDIDIRVLLSGNSVSEINNYIDKIRKLPEVESTNTSLVLKRF